MNYKMMGRFLSLIFAIEALFMLPSLLISLSDGTIATTKAFLGTILGLLLLAAILALCSRKAKKLFFAREGLFCVGVSWILMSFVGCFPFYLSGEIPHFIDSLFEMVSGFTTTGATVVANVEGLSRAVLYWRAFSHWLGGMGVLVFLLALVPTGGKNEGFTMHLLRAESPGPNVEKLVPKMRQTAIMLYVIYVVLTILNFLFLLFGGMSVFDALCTAFGTAGTGGFGVRNDSLAGFSPYIQNVCTVFMLLFGVNFASFYLLLLKHFRAVLKDEELRLYIGLFFVSALVIAFNIMSLYPSFWDSLRHSSFQVASIMTTTGFSTTNIDLWPGLSKGILLLLMLIGACAGSTAGGFKIARAILIFKGVRRNLAQMLRPQKVEVIRVNKKPIDEKIIANTNAYLCAYALIIVVSFLFVCLDNFSLITNLSAVISCFNNVGIAFDCNFAEFGVLSKIVLIVDMLAGRLEIFPILILFSSGTWKKA